MKRWLTNNEDLEAMNEKFTIGGICLWCDAQQSEDHVSRDRHHLRRNLVRDEKEKEVNVTFKDLRTNTKINSQDLNCDCGQG